MIWLWYKETYEETGSTISVQTQLPSSIIYAGWPVHRSLLISRLLCNKWAVVDISLSVAARLTKVLLNSSLPFDSSDQHPETIVCLRNYCNSPGDGTSSPRILPSVDAVVIPQDFSMRIASG